MPFGQPLSAVRPGFLVAVGEEDDVAIEARALRDVPQQRSSERGVGALHVQRAPAVQPAVSTLAGERSGGPSVRFDVDDVRVAEEQQGLVRAGSRDSGDEVRVVRSWRRDDIDARARGFPDLAEHLCMRHGHATCAGMRGVEPDHPRGQVQRVQVRRRDLGPLRVAGAGGRHHKPGRRRRARQSKQGASAQLSHCSYALAAVMHKSTAAPGGSAKSSRQIAPRMTTISL